MTRRREQRSPEAREYRRWYNLARWARYRDGQLVGGLSFEALQRDNFQCVWCGILLTLTKRSHAVDHIKPHKSDPALFWDLSNLQSLCASCHSRDKQRQERGTLTPRIGPDGWPID